MKKTEKKQGDGYDRDLFLTHVPSVTAKENFYYVQHIGHQHADDTYVINREGFESFVLQITIEGSGGLEYRGKSYDITPGHCMLLDCRDKQKYYCKSGSKWEFVWLHFDGCSSQAYFELIYNQLGPVFKLEDNGHIMKELELLMMQVEERDIDFEIKASVAILKILSKILLSKNDHTDFEITTANTGVKEVIHHIECNYRENISLELLANVAGYSQYHLHKIFKDATGYRPHEFLIKYRINRSKYLLKFTKQSIEQIAGEIGFESSGNYITTFKKLEGMTPLKFRKLFM